MLPAARVLVCCCVSVILVSFAGTTTADRQKLLRRIAKDEDPEIPALGFMRGPGGKWANRHEPLGPTIGFLQMVSETLLFGGSASTSSTETETPEAVDRRAVESDPHPVSALQLLSGAPEQTEPQESFLQGDVAPYAAGGSAQTGEFSDESRKKEASVRAGLEPRDDEEGAAAESGDGRFHTGYRDVISEFVPRNVAKGISETANADPLVAQDSVFINNLKEARMMKMRDELGTLFHDSAHFEERLSMICPPGLYGFAALDRTRGVSKDGVENTGTGIKAIDNDEYFQQEREKMSVFVSQPLRPGRPMICPKTTLKDVASLTAPGVIVKPRDVQANKLDVDSRLNAVVTCRISRDRDIGKAYLEYALPSNARQGAKMLRLHAGHIPDADDYYKPSTFHCSSVNYAAAGDAVAPYFDLIAPAGETARKRFDAMHVTGQQPWYVDLVNSKDVKYRAIDAGSSTLQSAPPHVVLNLLPGVPEPTHKVAVWGETVKGILDKDRKWVMVKTEDDRKKSPALDSGTPGDENDKSIDNFILVPGEAARPVPSIVYLPMQVPVRQFKGKKPLFSVSLSKVCSAQKSSSADRSSSLATATRGKAGKNQHEQKAGSGSAPATPATGNANGKKEDQKTTTGGKKPSSSLVEIREEEAQGQAMKPVETHSGGNSWFIPAKPDPCAEVPGKIAQRATDVFQEFGNADRAGVKVEVLEADDRVQVHGERSYFLDTRMRNRLKSEFREADLRFVPARQNTEVPALKQSEAPSPDLFVPTPDSSYQSSNDVGLAEKGVVILRDVPDAEMSSWSQEEKQGFELLEKNAWTGKKTVLAQGGADVCGFTSGDLQDVVQTKCSVALKPMPYAGVGEDFLKTGADLSKQMEQVEIMRKRKVMVLAKNAAATNFLIKNSWDLKISASLWAMTGSQRALAFCCGERFPLAKRIALTCRG
eukprot:g10029.t1